MVQSLWRTVWHFLKKLNMERPVDPAILLGAYPRELDGDRLRIPTFQRSKGEIDIWKMRI